jgi:ComF family protein
LCLRCRRDPGRLQAIIARYPFEGLVRSTVLAVKYRGRHRLVPLLASWVDQALAGRPLTVDALVPVPLSAARLRQRGFNQSLMIAQHLAPARSLSLEPGLLERTRDTKQQVRLPARQRQANVAEAFAVPPTADVTGRRLLLVDDVCTTGATLEACAGALLDAGASAVWGVVVARERLGGRRTRPPFRPVLE